MSTKSTRELIDRYQGFPSPHNQQFRNLVDMLVTQMIQHKIAPDEVRDAAFVASLKFLELHPVDIIYKRDDRG